MPIEDPGAEPTLGYHLYAQWVAAQQLTAAAAVVPLYADLPIGVHPDGFDPVWAPGAFAGGARGSAARPLLLGRPGLGVPPLHPERMRDDGYRYFISVLRRAFRHAAYLRVDHIMGLQRLYWIPEGFDARHGAYVSYRAEELHAVVALEAHRAGAVVVGEDLGTVPDGVRRRMADDRMLRSWVLQFESTVADPLPPAPTGVLASWGTHDLPRFPAYFSGDDIGEQEREGRLSTTDAAAQRSGRDRWRAALSVRSGSTTKVTSATCPHWRCGAACSIWPRGRRTSSWSTSRICGGSANRRTGPVPGLAAPIGGAEGRAHSPRRDATP